MLPEKSGRSRRQHLTTRQIQRRHAMPVEKATIDNQGNVKNVPSVVMGNRPNIIRFGKKSKLIKEPSKITIEIHEDDYAGITGHDLEKLLTVSKSPVLQSWRVTSVDEVISILGQKRRKMLHFGLYMNNIGHYSGGRYYLLFMSYLLAQMGHKVTVVSDKKALFLDDFKYIDVGDRLQWVDGVMLQKTHWLLSCNSNVFDAVIVSPLAIGGFSYATKWRIPAYAILFETPNYVKEYRGGADATEEYWLPNKRGINDSASCVVGISDISLGKVKEWLTEYTGRYDLVKPCINTWAADRVECPVEKNEIVFVGRHVEYKNPKDIIFAVSKVSEEIRPTINYVGSHSGKLRDDMVNYSDSLKVKIKFYANVSDEEKFYIIKRSKMMIFLSAFEGAGMPPAEALYCGKPVIAYDIPVLRVEYGDTLDYTPINAVKAVGERIEYYLTHEDERVNRGKCGREAIFKSGLPIPCLPAMMKKDMRRVFYNDKDLSITAGMIVLNGADTIELALKSIYDFVDKIVIVEGAVEDYAKVNSEMHKNGHSIDNTIKIIKDFDDPFDKIELVQNKRLWKNKAEMQNAIAKRIDTNLYLKVDADEIFIESDVEYMKRHFIDDPKLYVIQILKHEFWKGMDMVACGGQWDRPQARMWRWDKEFKHPLDSKTGFNYFIDADGVPVKSPDYGVLNLLEKLCYHLGYARNDDQIRAKINYYKNRGIEVGVKDNYSDWVEGQPTNSTHPDNTTAKKFEGQLPFILQGWYFDKVNIDPDEATDNNINLMVAPPHKT